MIKPGKSKGFVFIVLPEMVHQELLNIKNINKRGDFNLESESKTPKLRQVTQFCG